MTICPTCGAPLEDDDRFCTECGNLVPAGADATVVDAAPDRTPGTPPPAHPMPPVPRPPQTAPQAAVSTPSPGQAATTARRPWTGGQTALVAVAAVLAVAMLVAGVFVGRNVYERTHATPQATVSRSSGDGSSSGATAASCDADPDMQVVSVERSGNDLVVTILVTSTCSDGSATRFDDPKARITLKDADGDVMADNTFDFSGSRARTVTSDGTKVKVTYTPKMCRRPVADIVDAAGDDPSELIIRYIYRDRGATDDDADGSDSADASVPPSSTLRQYANTAGGYSIGVPDNFRKSGDTSDGTGYTFNGSGVTITTWRAANTTGSAAGEMARVEANAGVEITYDLNADPSIYVSYAKGGYIYYIKEIVYADHVIGMQLKYAQSNRAFGDPLTETIPPTLSSLG
ncbi:zinc ribbon domain-containing protein [Bifidobacterium platyrrhinorum]|nr:zinc ribbon domain-containing protein [Bifidobacterium platyrrhinorum]